MDFSIVVDNLGLYLQGLWTTIWMVAASLALGLCLSVPLAVMRTSPNPALNWPVWAYTYFFRGTPLLVQLFLIYYGLGPVRGGTGQHVSGRCSSRPGFAR